MPDGTPGDGVSSPFGDGQGATMAQGSSTGGRDFTAESRPQPQGPLDSIDPASIPQGGKFPTAAMDGWTGKDAVDGGVEPARTPFKNLRRASTR